MPKNIAQFLIILLLVSTGCSQTPMGFPPWKVTPPAPGESGYLANITQLTDTSMGFVNAGEAYFSPDQETIIFQATPQGKQEYQIYTLHLKSRKINLISTGRGACTCAFFRPDGKKIIFASSHLRPESTATQHNDDGSYSWNFDPYMDIFEANLDGSNLRPLTTTSGYDAEGAYSADGRSIVFTSKRDGDLEIYIMNADGSNQRRLTHEKGYDGGPFFSPSGDLILYRGDHRNDDKMNLQIRTMQPDGRSDQALTDNPLFNWCPYWYSDGRSFIFTQVNHEAWSTGTPPNYDLFMMDREGNGQTRITFDKAFDGLPVISVDGKKLMWTSKRGGLDEPQIFIADFTPPKAFR